jgi:VWFA-related protein
MSVLAAQAGAAQQRPVFRAAVDRVRVDVIVTDSAGRFIDDLVADDFVLLEDGKPQEVLSVELVDLSRGMVADVKWGREAADTVGAPGTVVETALRPSSSVADIGAVVFFLDLPGLNWRSKFVFARAWENLLARTESLGVPRAVYLVDQQMRFSELAPLTTDVGLVREAAQQVRSTPLVRQSLRDRIRYGDMVAEEYAQRERARSLFTLEMLARVCEGMSTREGRTALVWVSSGLSLQGFRVNVDGGIPLEPGTLVGDPQIVRRLAEVRDAANSANVSVYAIDPSTQSELRAAPLDAANATMPSLGRVRATNNMLAAQSDPLVAVARGTGGLAFVGWADLGQVFRVVEDDTSHYYLLTYAPPAPYNDGEYHRVTVEVSRPGVDVRARGGYVDYTEEDRHTRLVNAAISTPGLATEIHVVAEPYRTWRDETATVTLVFAVDPAEVGLGDVTAGATAIPVEVHAAVLDRWGQVVAELEHAIDEADLTGMPGADRVIRRYGLELDAGRYDLRVMVLDAATGRVGAAQLDLVVPAHRRDDWFTSDPMLVQVLPDLSFEPVVSGRILQGNPVTAQIEVYGGQRPEMSGRIEPVVTPGSAADPTDSAGSEIPPRSLVLTEEGFHRGELSLPWLPPGDYVLHLRATEPGTDREHSFELKVQVVAPVRAR